MVAALTSTISLARSATHCAAPNPSRTDNGTPATCQLFPPCGNWDSSACCNWEILKDAWLDHSHPPLVSPVTCLTPSTCLKNTLIGNNVKFRWALCSPYCRYALPDVLDHHQATWPAWPLPDGCNSYTRFVVCSNICPWERENPPCLWKDYICPTLSPPSY